MKTIESLQHFEQLMNTYLDELTGFSMEQLTWQPSENEWSLGQLYLHLINSALYMQIRNIEDCMSPNVGAVRSIEEKTEVGKAIFAQGAFRQYVFMFRLHRSIHPHNQETKNRLSKGLTLCCIE